MTITGSGGAPGSGSNIIIRGVTSLSPGRDNQPLFVIDGIPISNATQAGNPLPSVGSNAINSSEQFGFTNRAGDVNPDDIESINVLKGAAATALYGLRAANGAIIITTKKGKIDKVDINFSSSIGFDNVAKYPRVQTLYGQGSAGITREPYSGSAFQSNGPARSLTGEAFYDNFRNVFETGKRYNSTLSISGGSQTATYYTSVSRLDQSGIVPHTDYAKTTVALKGTINASEVFSVNASMNYTNSGGSRPRGGDKSIFSSLSYWSPSFDITDYKFPDGSAKNYTAGIVDQPLWFAENTKFTDNVNRLFGDVGFNYNPLSWLNVRYQATLDTYNDQRTSYAPANTDAGSQVGGFISEERFNYREINSNLLITGTFNLSDDLSASVLLGNAITDIKSDNLSTRGERFIVNQFYDLANTTNFFASRSQSVRRIVGFFANAQVSWRETLYLTLSGRNDISSTLPSDSRSFFYPSASLSFVLTELFKDAIPRDILSSARLRASWAQVGKDVEPYSVGEYYQVATGFPFGSTGGFRVNPQAGALNLRPERTTGIELGGEFKFANDRVTLDANYAIQTSKDQLFQIPVSNASGYARYTQNGGELESRTFELLLRATPIETQDFSWDFSANFSRTKGEVLSMPVGIDEISFGSDPAGTIFNKVVKGGAIGDLWGYDVVKNAEGRMIINQTTGLPTLKDSLIVVGNAFPDFQLGFTNTFTWNGISLSFFIEWRKGGNVVDMGERNTYRNGVAGFTDLRYQEAVFTGVAPDGSTNTVPAFIDPNIYRGSFNSTKYMNLQDGSWIRLRNVTLSYSLPKSLLEGTFLRLVRVNLTGNNLFLSTPFRGFDPDALAFGAGTNIFGLVGRNTPPLRSISFSVNLGF